MGPTCACLGMCLLSRCTMAGMFSYTFEAVSAGSEMTGRMMCRFNLTSTATSTLTQRRLWSTASLTK